MTVAYAGLGDGWQTRHCCVSGERASVRARAGLPYDVATARDRPKNRTMLARVRKTMAERDEGFTRRLGLPGGQSA